MLADIKKKHSAHAVTADVSLADTARAAKFFRADGVVVTGAGTGVSSTHSTTVNYLLRACMAFW